MKSLLIILLSTFFLSNCGGGGSGDSLPSDLSGTWYGESQIGGRYFTMAATFLPLGNEQYQMEMSLDGSMGANWRRSEPVSYSASQILTQNGYFAQVYPDYIYVPLTINDNGMPLVGSITIYRQ